MRQQLRLKTITGVIYEPCLVTGIFENGARRYAGGDRRTIQHHAAGGSENLPSPTVVSGDKFDTVWDTVCEWGNVTTLVHTTDVILEFSGELPSGFHRHGYFNLRGKHGMSGHIKAENCTHIALIERKFMGMDTASILFFNKEGSAMLKIFLGRDDHRQLLSEQVSAFHALAASLKEHA